MTTDDTDDLVAFQDVRILRATAPALLCLINGKSVWLPRGHISGKLWCAGDRGKLFVRRGVAHERQLIDLPGALIPSLAQAALPPALPVQLHLVSSDRGTSPDGRLPRSGR